MRQHGEIGRRSDSAAAGERLAPRFASIAGWACAPAVWAPLEAALGGAFRFLRWDWRRLLDEAGRRTMLKSIAGSEERIVLAGWSAGGALALQLAAMAPERFSGLILISSFAQLAGENGADPRALLAMRRRLDRNPRAVVRDFFAACLSPGGDPMLRDAWEGEAAAMEAEILKQGLDCLLHLDLRDRLPQIAVPALVVHGARDAVAPVELGRLLARGLPRAEWLELPDAGHAPIAAPSQALVTAIREFAEAVADG